MFARLCPLLLMNEHITSEHVTLHPLAIVVVGNVAMAEDEQRGQHIKLSICFFNGCSSRNTSVGCGTMLDLPGTDAEDGPVTDEMEVSIAFVQNCNTRGLLGVGDTSRVLSLVAKVVQERLTPLVLFCKGPSALPAT